MARGRMYSDQAIATVMANIQNMLGGSPEEALQQAQIARQVAEAEKARGGIDARNSIANAFANFDDPSAIRGSANTIYADALRGGVDPADIASALLGYGGAGGATNDQLGGLYVGSGKPIRPGDAFTVARQNELARDAERVGDEELAAKLGNEMAIASMREEGLTDRFNRQPIELAPGAVSYFGDKTFRGVDTPATVRGGLMGKKAGGTPLTPAEEAVMALSGETERPRTALDVSPNDIENMGVMIDTMAGAEMPDEVRSRVLLRASELYQQTRNAGGAVQQALSELTQPGTRPRELFGVQIPLTAVPQTQLKPTGAAPAIVDPGEVVTPETGDPFGNFTPTDAAPAAQPQRGAPVDGTVQRKQKPDGTYEYRIWKNGTPQPYAP